MSDNYTIIGRISPVYQGVWASTTEYKRLDIVSNSDKTIAYIARKDVPAGTSLASEAYWSVVLNVVDVLDSANEEIDGAIIRVEAAVARAPAPLALEDANVPAVIWPEKRSPIRLKADILFTQSGSGTPAPNNIRPIEGVDQINVMRSGRNLFPHGRSVAVERYVNLPLDVPLPPGTYTISGSVTSTDADVSTSAVGFNDMSTGSIGKYVSFKRTGARESYQVTLDFYANSIRLLAGTNITDSLGDTAVWTDIQIEIGDEVSDYEEYQGEAFALSLEQMVYGGTIDVENSALTINRECMTFNGTENWSYAANVEVPYWFLRIGDAGYVVVGEGTQFCSHYKYEVMTTTTTNTDCFYIYNASAGDARIIMRPSDSNITDLETWKAYLAAQNASGTPIQVCYELASPTTSTISTENIPALPGLNVVFSDGKNAVVTYNEPIISALSKLNVNIEACDNRIDLCENRIDLLEDDVKVESHTDGVGAVVEVGETYFNVAYDPNDMIVYATGVGPYGASTTNSNGVKAIVCSQFAQACFGGIKYQHSRYVEDANERTYWGFVSDGTGTYSNTTTWDANSDYMTAAEQARYFETHGGLYVFDVNRNALLPGDLLFYVDQDSATYKNISHVGICLGASKEHYTVMHSYVNQTRLVDGQPTGVVAKRFDYSNYAPAYYARSPVNAEYTTTLIKSGELNAVGNYGIGNTSERVVVINLPDAMPRGFYTMVVNSDDDSEAYVKVTYDGVDSNNDGNDDDVNYWPNKNAGRSVTVFYAEAAFSRIEIRVINGTHYNCKDYTLYKGYHN